MSKELPPYSPTPGQQGPQQVYAAPQVQQVYAAPPQQQQAFAQQPPQVYAAAPIPGQQQQYYVQQPQAQGQPYVPPVHIQQRNNALIEQYQKEIEDNQIGCVEICWFVCCGFFGLICCLPKYNAQQRARANLDIELAKARQ
ncbi:hypothetical protein BGZ76_003384 [Entomortierella beljakovae]|nr:hypothetical protein BGZ76_003384 [Entomortierella beljakovae]